MNEHTNDNLAARVDKLERENRRLKGGVGVVIALLTLGLVGTWFLTRREPAPAVPDEIQTRKLVVVDSNGKQRVSLGTFEHGPGISLFDDNGRARLVMRWAEGAPGIFLLDDAGTKRAGLTLVDSGPILAFHDGADMTRAAILLNESESRLVLFKKDGSSSTLP
jgi:hypothetical protein